MSKMFAVLILELALVASPTAQTQITCRDGDYVPDERTAISIAVAVLIPIYGEAAVAHEQPFHALLLDKKVWIVEGSMPAGPSEVGGVATLKLLRSDGRILLVTHGK